MAAIPDSSAFKSEYAGMATIGNPGSRNKYGKLFYSFLS
jgi:hypothetical protein